MKILKNKFTLSLGSTIAVIAPVASVVACGESSVNDISDSEKNQRETLNKSQQFIQTKYQEYLISQISASQSSQSSHGKFGTDITEEELHDYTKLKPAIKSEILDFVKRNIYSSSAYLKTFADKLLHTNDENTKKFYTRDQLVNAGFYDFYLAKTDIDANSNKQKIEYLVKNFIGVIWKENIANFRNSFYQYMISSYYLSTNYSFWSDVFVNPVGSTDKLVGMESALDQTSNQFVLALKTLRAKLAFDWNVSLDDIASKAYAGVSMPEGKLNDELSNQNQKTTSIYANANTTTQKSIIPGFDWDGSKTKNSIWELVEENKNIIGFNGVVSKASFVPTKPEQAFVSYTSEDEASKAYDDKYAGYVNPEKTGEIVKDPNKQIKLTTPSNSKVSLEKIIMILPRNINGKLSIESLRSSDGNGSYNYNILKQIIIANDSSIYNEAITYYSSKDNHEFNWNATTKTGGIRLKFTPEAYELEKLAIDTYKFPFIEKNED